MGMNVQSGGPTALLLSRQNLPFIKRDEQTINAISKGGYVLREAKGRLQAIIIATGSEVELALQAQKQLAEKDIHARVVSMPCVELFEAQERSWREQVLPVEIPKMAVEAGSTLGWYKYVGTEGVVVGLDKYGKSAPAADLFEHFGITAAHVVAAVESILSS